MRKIKLLVFSYAIILFGENVFVANLIAICNSRTDPFLRPNAPGFLSEMRSTRHVLKKEIEFASEDFDQNYFKNFDLFPFIGIVRTAAIQECVLLSPEPTTGFVWDEFVSWHADQVDQRGAPQKVGEELLQEVGFIEMIRNHYPRSFAIDMDGILTNQSLPTISVETLSRLSPPPLLFLPMCGYLGEGTDRHPFGKHLTGADLAVSRLQKNIHPKHIFYIAPHPLCHPDSFLNLIYNTRRLHTDETVRGSYSDIVIPVSTTPSVCKGNLHGAARTNLLYACGSEHSIRYKGFRSMITLLFRSLNRTDVDVSLERTQEDYESGFWRSKFCFVVPGDTTSTSQTTRAMCANCVPIFVSPDFRDLPFSNILDYSTFSLRVHPNDLLNGMDNDAKLVRAESLYVSLQEMISNGTYDRLRTNVAIASDFFRYSRFGSRSPYGASLVSMYQDFHNENK